MRPRIVRQVSKKLKPTSRAHLLIRPSITTANVLRNTTTALVVVVSNAHAPCAALRQRRRAHNTNKVAINASINCTPVHAKEAVRNRRRSKLVNVAQRHTAVCAWRSVSDAVQGARAYALHMHSRAMQSVRSAFGEQAPITDYALQPPRSFKQPPDAPHAAFASTLHTVPKGNGSKVNMQKGKPAPLSAASCVQAHPHTTRNRHVQREHDYY